MKQIYILLIFLCGISVNAQIINFADANFKAKLLEAAPSNQIAKNLSGDFFKIDANSDGEIQTSEAQVVTWLNVRNSLITDISGILYFSALQHLDCGNEGATQFNWMPSINLSGLSNLRFLDCSNNWTLTNLNLTGCINLEVLYCYQHNLTSLDMSSFPNLQILSCYGNNLTSLNVTNCENLQTLSCAGSPLTTLDLSDCVNLLNLSCGISWLTSLDLTSCPNLQSVDCNEAALTSLLVSGLTNLESISFYLNDLTSVDLTSCSNLREIDAWANDLISLDVSGLTQLESIDVRLNDLVTLNLSECTSLEYIDCSENNLTSLDIISFPNLHTLYARSNSIAELQVNGLENLDFADLHGNALSTLDISGCKVLEHLFLSNNENLITLNIKNGVAISSFSCDNNPQLAYVCCDESDLPFLYYLSAEINTYCTFTPGGDFSTVGGSSRYNVNFSECEASNPAIPNMKYSVSNGTNSGFVIANASGLYSIPFAEGNLTFTPIIQNSFDYDISPPAVTVNYENAPSSSIFDFCITPIAPFNDVEIVFVPTTVARPGFDSSYSLVFKNNGSTVISGTITLNFDDALIDFMNSSPVPLNQSGNILTWEYENLLPFETRIIASVFNVNSPMETPAVNIGDRLSFLLEIHSDVTDNYPNNNTSTLKQLVVGSLDPNDKTCIEGATISPSEVGEYVHYVIRFENTGTYFAENIVVKDMIDISKFDLSTLVPIHSSHEFTTRITNTNKVEFIFENINLPFDDANNDGYIAFKIKTKPNLVVGSTFSNTASIYFDYNFPIITNTATTTIVALSNPDFDFGKFFTIHPNPANDILNISSVNPIEVKSIAIFNMLGQQLIVIPNAQGIASVDISSLQSGTYFIKVSTDQGISSSKFIKK